MGHDEVLVSSELLVAVEHGRITLRSKSILVSIAGDGCDTRLTEVEAALVLIWARETGLLHEGNDEGAQAAVDVEGNLILDSELGERGNIINHAVREVGSRSNKENGVGVDQSGNRRNIDLIFWSRARDSVELDAEIMACLIKSSVSGIRDNPIKCQSRHNS